METFQRVKLDGYAMVISELEVELDLLRRASAEICVVVCVVTMPSLPVSASLVQYRPVTRQSQKEELTSSKHWF